MHHAHRHALGILICAITVAAVAARQSTTADAILGEALHQEEVAGDLEKAIAGFKRVIADPSAGRPMVAKALLHLGRSQERLGQTNAKAAYERIERDFVDQPEILAQARARLVALGGARGDDAGVVTKQLWAGENVDPFGSPSSDGRLYAYVDWSSGADGAIAVRDLTTGQTRRLTTGGGYAMNPAISPDGKHVAYFWDGDGLSLRVIDIATAKSLTVLDKQPDIPLGSLKWSPDGRQLAAVGASPHDHTERIVLVTVASGQMTTLKNLGWQGHELGSYSPDGRYLLHAPSTESTTGAEDGIYAIAVDGSKETRLVHSGAKDTAPSWTPDGRGVVFLSNRSGSTDLWLQRIKDGAPLGDAQLLRNNVGDIIPMGFRNDGLFYYGFINRQVDAYLCPLEPETLRVSAVPVRLTERFIGTNSGASWSPDGQHISFFRGAARRTMSLVVRSAADGTERTLSAPFTDTIFAGRMGATWMPDGRTVVVPDPEYAADLWRYRSVDTETGASHVLVEDRNVFGEARVTSDGRYLLYTGVERPAQAGAKVLRLIRRELRSGAETELYRADSEGVSFFGLAVSPDGREIAFMANEGSGRTLNSVPIGGGPRRILYRGTYSRPSPFGAVWTPDGRYILTVGNASKGGSTLLAFPADGGEPRALDVSMQEILAPSISPDGRHLLFTGAKRQHEVWTIRHLLPRSPVENSASR